MAVFNIPHMLWRTVVRALVVGTLTGGASAGEFRLGTRWDMPAPPVIESAMGSPALSGDSALPVAQDGDQLVFENGKAARFWGVGLTFSGGKSTKFPPPKRDAAHLVRKLKSFGFNHVRFVGFDNMAPEPFLSWSRYGRLDSETMDRFDYFVAELKKAGFHYSISINNSAVLPLGYGGIVEPNDSAQKKLWRFKYIRLYEDRAVDRIIDWCIAFFSHVNSYTGLSYAEDAANLYVSAANEDSLFEPFFMNFKTLDRRHHDKLAAHFAEYLAGRYGGLSVATAAWHREGGERCYQGSSSEAPGPELLGAGDLAETCARRIADTVAFLVRMDGYAARKLKEALRGIGYRGLFSVTNNWYGYGALEANVRDGNYIDMHGYFWHPRRYAAFPKSESVVNSSFIANPASLSELDREFSYPLSKAFRAATPSRPLLFSEWGVGGWNEYQYEAPLVMMAYSAFQGYASLDVHTYFNHPNPDPKDPVSRYALTVSGNAALMSLMPSLSIGFRRGDIATPAESRTYRCATSEDDFMSKVLRYRLSRVGMQCGYYANEGYVNKVRVVPYADNGADGDLLVGRDYGDEDVLQTTTGQILWRRRPLSAASFLVNTARFKAAAVAQDNRAVTVGDVRLRFRSRGAVTMVSLDGEPLDQSPNVLITTVRTFQNEGVRSRESAGRRTISDPGRAPVSFETADVDVAWAGRPSGRELVLCAVHLDGRMSLLKRFAALETPSQKVEFEIGQAPTPWYWLGEPGDDRVCDGGLPELAYQQ